MATIWRGRPYPLGATWDGDGVNFSLFSRVAVGVELCLFDALGAETRIDLPERTADRWHGYVPDLAPGQRYGFRVHGPYAPADGLRCNPAKLLLDPYARAVEGRFVQNASLYSYNMSDPRQDLSRNDVDSAGFVARSIVSDPSFDWSGDRPPATDWHDTVIYEVHVKGFTARHPDIPEQLRGTYAGLAHPAALTHLTRLGITAVELLPVHQFFDPVLEGRGSSNYWGYNTLGYFAPHNAYSSSGERGEQIADFKSMVRALHGAGVEVILDVVYNHTAEGDHLGPTVCFRGIDNQAYYRLVGDQPRYYTDYVGVGNTLNARDPHVLQMIMDSLRYWVQEMHVDGFRFDSAAALARGLHEVDRLSAFFDLVQQDPVISQVKLIAEPWDLGEGGYQVGNFPVLWSEWNGKYRDTVRDYWRGAERTLGDLAYRLTGSSDLYENGGRRPCASINFITSHDGFTLEDLVSYERKHNERNGEDNRDGSNDNRSSNNGAEGPTDDPDILELRARQKRNLLVTLLLSQGVPMLLGGDEMGRTQHGNNNAYCQDNEISWFDWEHQDEALIEFVSGLCLLRRQHPVFRRHRWFQGRSVRGSGLTDIAWFDAHGRELTSGDWEVPSAISLQVYLSGQEGPDPGPRGEPIHDSNFLLVLHAGANPVGFLLPGREWGDRWVKQLDTGVHVLVGEHQPLASGASLEIGAHSLVLLRSED